MARAENNYHKSRFKFDPGRQKVWRAITEDLQQHIGLDKSVLDLGSGYGDFINLIKAKKKVALDIGPDVKDYISKEVEFLNTPATSVVNIPKNSLDVVFSSNLLEHLDRNEIDATMRGVHGSLKDGGVLILIGPNYRYAYKEYFDDYTHKTIFSHVTLVDLMFEYGFKAHTVIPRYLPLSLKSRLPKSYWLTKLYIASPIKPLGKQMLIVLKKES